MAGSNYVEYAKSIADVSFGMLPKETTVTQRFCQNVQALLLL